MFSKEKIKKRLTKILSLDAHPKHISTGFAVGVFISFIPPIPGLHTALALSLAFIFRLNKISCISGSMVNSYLTTVPSLIISYKIGAFMLGLPSEWKIEHLNWDYLKIILIRDAKPLILGCAILGFIAANIAYFALHRAIITFRSKDATTDELTREMEITGEEL